MEFSPRAIERMSHWTYQDLKDKLTAACRFGYEGLVGYDNLPKHIDLGSTPQSFGFKAEECARATKEDDLHRERGLNIVWDGDNKRLLASTMRAVAVGTENDVSVPIHFSYPSIGSIHSHPDASPFSSVDVSFFLLRQSDVQHRIAILGTIDGSIRALIATRDTARLTHVDAMLQWRRVMSQRFVHASRYIQETDALIAQYGQKYKFGYYIGESSGVVCRYGLSEK